MSLSLPFIIHHKTQEEKKADSFSFQFFQLLVAVLLRPHAAEAVCFMRTCLT